MRRVSIPGRKGKPGRNGFPGNRRNEQGKFPRGSPRKAERHPAGGFPSAGPGSTRGSSFRTPQGSETSREGGDHCSKDGKSARAAPPGPVADGSSRRFRSPAGSLCPSDSGPSTPRGSFTRGRSPTGGSRAPFEIHAEFRQRGHLRGHPGDGRDDEPQLHHRPEG